MQPTTTAAATTTSTTPSLTSVTIHVPPCDDATAMGRAWKRPCVETETGESKTSPDLLHKPLKKSREEDFNSRLRNLKKAVENHWQGALPADREVYLSANEFAQLPISPQPGLKFTVDGLSDLGYLRKTNEDVIFETKIEPHGTLVAVLDGHSPGGLSGEALAQFIRDKFPPIFCAALEKAQGRIQAAFHKSAKKIQAAIKAELPTTTAGSTAVFVFIEEATGYAHTLTVGDSFAFAYRKINQIWRAIPVSPIRNWTYKADGERACQGQGPWLTTDKYNFLSYEDVCQLLQDDRIDPKDVRLRKKPYPNVSRSFGDFDSVCDGNGVTTKGKVSTVVLREGDCMLLLCDGVTDFLRAHKIQMIFKSFCSQCVIGEIVRQSHVEMVRRSIGDNISALMVRVQGRH